MTSDGTMNGGRKLRDAFMEDYQLLSNKCNNANQMSLQLDKQVLFDVGTLSYFDKSLNAKHERIVVNRNCHYSDPELTLQMEANKFESLLKSLTYYHQLSEADGQTVAAETLDDDPFIPEQTETMLGEARLKLSGRKLSKQMIVLPINTASGDKIGEMSVEVTFKLLDENNTNCYDMKKMENQEVAMMIEFDKIETELELQYLKFTFCAVTKDIVTVSNKRNDIDALMVAFDEKTSDDNMDESIINNKSTIHHFEDSYEVSSILMSPAFKNYLSAPGIVFKIWALVFDDVSQMPPIIAYKIRSKKITLKIKLPDGEILDLICKTGNKISSIKRKIEFRTEIGDYQQKVYYNDILLDDKRSLLDYDIDGQNSLLILKVDGANDDGDGTDTYDKRSSLIDLKSDDLMKELTNPRLSQKERGKIRRLKNKSIHMALLQDDLENESTMTLESYQEQNAKLREELQRANKRIETLERELAVEKSKGSKKTKSKVFGSWRRSKNNDSK